MNEMLDILRKMRVLSEASAATLERSNSPMKPGTKPPPGVGRTTNRNGEPDEHWSLHEHYRYKWNKAQDDQERRVVLCAARVALRTRLKGPEPHPHAEGLTDQEQQARELEDVRVLLEHGEGVYAAEIAASRGWPVSWVKTQRERNGRDPDYGRQRPKWSALTKQERLLLASRYAFQGFTLRGAARELGISHTSLRPYYPRQERHVA